MDADMKDTLYVLERIFIAWGLSAYAFDMNQRVWGKVSNYLETEADTLEKDENVIKELKDLWQKQQSPVLMMENESVYYLGFEGRERVFYAMGPATTEEMGKINLKAFKDKHKITIPYYNVPVLAIHKAVNALAFCYYILTGIPLKENDIIQMNTAARYVSERDMADYKMNIMVNEISRRPYSDEYEFLHAIENGDIEYFKKPAFRMLIENSGVVAKKSKKQAEYQAVSGITLATRAAITAGLNPVEAYALSDMYLQKLELSSTTLENQAIVEAAIIDFTQRIKTKKQQIKNSDFVERCKDYINTNYHHPLKISEIADKLGINRTYLSRKFTEQAGLTISDYISKVRLEAAANMLKYSEVSISDIAEYLCYNSQSYFSDQFKSEYRMTPSNYRRNNKVIDFSS